MRAAILAANPHNSQPWRFRVADNAIDVFADADSQALMPFRIGYPTVDARPSPRHDLKSVLM